MKITMIQSEIFAAIEMWIESQGLATTGKDVDIKLAATRGPEGYTADVDITSSGTAPAPTVAKPAAEQNVSTPEPKSEEAPDAPETEAEEPTEEKTEEKPKTEAKASIFGNMKKPVNA